MAQAVSFIPGLELNRRFYTAAVRPALEAGFPGLVYSAALIWPGSDVLGFDTAMSTDHDWGPRLMLFLPQADFERLAGPIRQTLAQRLPPEFLGYPTVYTRNADGTLAPATAETGANLHRIEIHSLKGYLLAYLDHDLEEPLEAADWLSFPEQKLRSLTGGAVYHDEAGLEAVRARLRWYPPDVWRYRLAAIWSRIGEDEHLAGRAGSAGDEAGSAIITARLCRDLMRLALLMDRQYPPYPKWLGTAFNRLPAAGELAPHLWAALQAGRWPERQEAQAAACEAAARLHNSLGLTEPVPPAATRFYGRPYRVIWGERFAHALLAGLQDPALQRLAAAPPIGAIDDWSDSTALLSDPRFRRAARRLYTEPG